MDSNDKVLFWQIIKLIMFMVFGLPLLLLVIILMFLGAVFIFTLLVGSLIITTAPFLVISDPNMANLLEGVPPNSIMYFGAALTCFTTIVFITYIFVIIFVARLLRKFFRFLTSKEEI